MDKLKNLGINTVNLTIEKAVELGLGRIELSLGKEEDYQDKLRRFYFDINKAENLRIPYSIHLPVHVDDWYPYGYFSAFFIDENEEKRNLSLRLLEDNLKRLKDYKPDYYVLHFPGIAKLWENPPKFKNILHTSLTKINQLAEDYGSIICLEYFGSNENFYNCNEWIETIKRYKNLEILVDTGHLYFAAIKNGFDFIESLNTLVPSSYAFHLWTTKGKKAYCDSEYYNEYHHIAPHSGQNTKEGWAFNTEDMIKTLAKENKPLIIEPSIKYGGEDYLIEGINSVKKILEDI